MAFLMPETRETKMIWYSFPIEFWQFRSQEEVSVDSGLLGWEVVCLLKRKLTEGFVSVFFQVLRVSLEEFLQDFCSVLFACLSLRAAV